MGSILTSLLVDNSTTVCTIELTMLTKLLPIFAVHARDDLKRVLPQLFAVLARIICWRDRKPASAANIADAVENASSDEADNKDDDEKSPNAVEGIRALGVHADLDWDRLELSFSATAAPAPSSRRYFAFLYYLFPCNMVAFLRRPAGYLTERSVASPYAVDWKEALDHDQIKTRSQVALSLTHTRLPPRHLI